MQPENHNDSISDSSSAPNTDAETTVHLWLRYGDPTDHEYEDFIVGSRLGLEVLRSHIDEALKNENGIAWFDHSGIGFMGVRMSDAPDPDPPKGGDLKATLLGWGCLFVVVMVLGLAALGIRSLFM
jgi:hypothetical protein